MKIVFDFDETIVNTIHSVVDCYNDDYKEHENYIIPNPQCVQQWNMLDQLFLANNNFMNSIFEEKRFFEKLTVKDGMKEFISELQLDGHQVVICTKGTFKNISMKSEFINHHFPNVETIFMSIDNTTKSEINKSLIDMSYGIIIDDHQDNLFSSNAKYKICFAEYGLDKEWNYKWTEYSVKSVEELKHIITKIIKYD